MNIFSSGKMNPLTPSAKAEAAYKKPVIESGKAGDARAKTDTIELSGRSAQGVQKQLPALGSSILYEVSKGADPQRLEALRSRVADGAYFVPSGELAESMLGISI